MTDPNELNRSVYSSAVYNFVQENKLVTEQKLNALNRMASTLDNSIESSEHLLLHMEGQQRLNARLIAPELDRLTADIVEWRRLAGVDQPAPTEPPTPPIHGARTLLMNEDGTGRIDPVRTQVMPGAETDDYTEEDPPSDVSH